MAAHHQPHFERTFRPAAGSVPEVRRAYRRWLVDNGVSDGTADELALVASELCANAVEAARSAVVLRGSLQQGYVVLEVADDGPGFRSKLPGRRDRPSPSADRGRGLYVVRELVDTLWVSSSEGGTVARCARRVETVAR